MGVTSQETPMTSIHSLPFDVIHAVFRLVTRDNTHFSIAVSHVCSRWRQFAIDSPCLWSTVSFLHPRTHKLAKGGIIMRITSPNFEMQRMYLLRSQDYLLEISINHRDLEDDGGGEYVTFSQKQLSTIMKLVLPHINRWRSFSVGRISHAGCQNVFDRLLSRDAPNLEVLRARVTCGTPEACRWRFRPFRGGLGAPLLHSLEIGPGIGLRQWKGHLFSSLKSLRLSYSDEHSRTPTVHLRHLIPLLSLNLSLQNLSFDFGPHFLSGPDLSGLRESPLVLPYLKSLYLNAASQTSDGYIKHEMVDLLLALHIPNLTYLSPSKFRFSSIEKLASAPIISFNKIQDITLGFPHRTVDVFRIVTQLQHLQSLTIVSHFALTSSCDWEIHLVNPLCTMLPHLQTVKVITETLWDEPVGAIVTMEHLRRICTARSIDPDLAPITTVDIRGRKVHDEDREWFDERGIHLIPEPYIPAQPIPFRKSYGGCRGRKRP